MLKTNKIKLNFLISLFFLFFLNISSLAFSSPKCSSLGVGERLNKSFVMLKKSAVLGKDYIRTFYINKDKIVWCGKCHFPGNDYCLLKKTVPFVTFINLSTYQPLGGLKYSNMKDISYKKKPKKAGKLVIQLKEAERGRKKLILTECSEGGDGQFTRECSSPRQIRNFKAIIEQRIKSLGKPDPVPNPSIVRDCPCIGSCDSSKKTSTCNVSSFGNKSLPLSCSNSYSSEIKKNKLPPRRHYRKCNVRDGDLEITKFQVTISNLLASTVGYFGDLLKEKTPKEIKKSLGNEITPAEEDFLSIGGRLIGIKKIKNLSTIEIKIDSKNHNWASLLSEKAKSFIIKMKTRDKHSPILIDLYIKNKKNSRMTIVRVPLTFRASLRLKIRTMNIPENFNGLRQLHQNKSPICFSIKNMDWNDVEVIEIGEIYNVSDEYSLPKRNGSFPFFVSLVKPFLHSIINKSLSRFLLTDKIHHAAEYFIFKNMHQIEGKSLVDLKINRFFGGLLLKWPPFIGKKPFDSRIKFLRSSSGYTGCKNNL